MGLFERIMKQDTAAAGRTQTVVLYHSPVCMECHAARDFFDKHRITVDERDVSQESVRDRMQQDLGRVATPAIVVGKRVFWGFEDNRQDIADLLGIAEGDDRSSGMPDPDE